MTLQLSAWSEARPGALVVTYRVHNPMPLPVLVFDRRWDHDADAIDRQWMEVIFDGHKAMLVRGYMAPPEGVVAPEVPVAYGRRLEPGATHATEVTLPLPLAERALWLALQRGPLAEGEAPTVPLEEIELHLGWCVLHSTDGLPEASREPLEIEGERMHWLDAALIASAQQTATARVASAALVGTRFSGGAA